jgi:Cys-tRNA(Pro)/Cys-tRNA(Cys) deacylase
MPIEEAVMQKTNAMRALDQRKILYETHEFSDAIRSADGVAATLGTPEDEVFKTLVVVPEGRGKKPMLVMLPASKELDLRRFARAVGEKSVRMATQREAEQLTGLKVGGISALALLNKPFTVYLDASATALDLLYISGGQRGLDLRLRPRDLIAVTGAIVVETGENREDVKSTKGAKDAKKRETIEGCSVGG